MGVDKQPALLEVVGFQMYFIKDCCYIKKKKNFTRITYCTTIKKCCFVRYQTPVLLLGTITFGKH